MSRAVIRKYVYCAVWSAGLFAFLDIAHGVEDKDD